VIGHLDVGWVGLGAKRLLRSDSYASADREAAVRLLRRVVELGVDHIDTAASYPSVANASRGRPASPRSTSPTS
jgi:pyridoxine 4-dehydrogenase